MAQLNRQRGRDADGGARCTTEGECTTRGKGSRTARVARAAQQKANVQQDSTGGKGTRAAQGTAARHDPCSVDNDVERQMHNRGQTYNRRQRQQDSTGRKGSSAVHHDPCTVDDDIERLSAAVVLGGEALHGRHVRHVDNLQHHLLAPAPLFHFLDGIFALPTDLRSDVPSKLRSDVPTEPRGNDANRAL